MSAERPVVLLAPGDGGGVLRLFVPLAARLRTLGYEVRFFTTNLRDRLLLRRHGEAPLAARVEGPQIAVPELVARAAAVRVGKSALATGSRAHRNARSVLHAAHAAVEDVDLVVVWNGSDLQTAAIADVARANRRTIWFLENGLIPGHVQCDPAGVNAAASSAVHSAAASDTPVDERRAPRRPQRAADSGRVDLRSFRQPPLWWRGFATALEWIEALWAPDRARLTIGARLRDMRSARMRRRPLQRGDFEPLPDRFVFVPLQVHDDSNIWRHGGWVDSMGTLCQALREACRGLPVVVRQHPMDVGRTDYERLQREYPEFLWTRTRDLDECLHRAAAVVTVNSTVGFEALGLDRPVVVCGNAVYGDPSAVELAERELRPALHRALEHKTAKPGAAGVRDSLCRELHVEVDRLTPDGPGLDRLIARITGPIATRRIEDLSACAAEHAVVVEHAIRDRESSTRQ